MIQRVTVQSAKIISCMKPTSEYLILKKSEESTNLIHLIRNHNNLQKGQMLRDILTSRIFLGTFVFCFLIIVSIQIYSWYIQQTIEAELQQTIHALRTLKNKQERLPKKIYRVQVSPNFSLTYLVPSIL